MEHNGTTLTESARQFLATPTSAVVSTTAGTIMSILLIPAIPIFIHERSQPMIKYRSWTINIVACISITMCVVLDTFRHVAYISYEAFPYVQLVENLLYIITACCFLPIYLRHYFLLRLPILQQNLLSHKTMLDPIKYRELSKALVKTKFLSSEKGAWMFYLVNVVPCLAMTFYFFTISDKDMEILNMPTPISLYIGIMLVIQIVLSAGFIFWYGPWSPKDNFQIMIQFYFITGTTLANVLVGLIKLLFPNPSVAKICLNLQTVCACLAVCINIVMPLQFIVNKRNHMIKLYHSSDQLSIRSKSSLLLTPSEKISSINSQKISQCLTDGRDLTLVNIGKSTPTTPTPHIHFKSNLQKILADPAVYTAFCTFLSREFSLESLLFIEAVKNFKIQVKDTLNIEMVEMFSNQIQDNFIQPDSVNEVNLPKKIINQINSTLQDILKGEISIERAITIYDHAADHIDQMLTVNHLRKFQASDLYRGTAVST
ncbi:Regulator of G-protein signaling 7 [Batrachochytrium dendrobatidis]|nr:Regulator of G-protein signaling 7 [Batrachochytrium dendrobatidis]KAK5664987.1 Regulator of G-protein signaling 7 [Batrachochytrium dendrobatidis]